MSGPVPNRSDDLSRKRNANRANRPDVTKAEAFPVDVPPTPGDWHPIAKQVFESLKTSGQSQFYQNSDWAFAFLICSDLDFYLKEDRNRSAMRAQTIYSALGNLMMTEADRRRLRIELQAPPENTESARVIAIRGAKAMVLD